MIGMYTSYYINRDRNTVRTYIIEYKTVDGVQKGFDILENEQLLVPNGSFTDKPGPTGVGEKPSEITSGFSENGDGTQTKTYDVSFRIDRYEVGDIVFTDCRSDAMLLERSLARISTDNVRNYAFHVFAEGDVDSVTVRSSAQRDAPAAAKFVALDMGQPVRMHRNACHVLTFFVPGAMVRESIE